MNTESFISNKLDECLFSVYLKDLGNDDVLISDAQARLYSSPDGLTIISVVAPMLPTVKDQWPVGSYRNVGALMFTALTANGVPVTGKVAKAHRKRLFAKTTFQEWEILCYEISQEEQTNQKPTGAYLVVDGINESIFFNVGTKSTSGFYDDLISSEYNWLQVEVDGCTYRLNKADSVTGCSSLQILINDPTHQNALAITMCQVLSLRLGRRISIWSHSSIENGIHTTIWYPLAKIRKMHPFCYPPVSMRFGDNVDRSFLPFAVTAMSRLTFANRLYDLWLPIWDTAIAPFRTRCLNVTTATEGLMDLIIDQCGNSDDFKKLQSNLKRTNKESLKRVRDQIYGLLDAISDPRDIDMCKRFRAAVAHVRSESPTDTLALAASSVGADLSAEEITDWESLRNEVAHGVIHSEAETSVIRRKFLSCINIMNKLSMKLIGWDGNIETYSETPR